MAAPQRITGNTDLGATTFLAIVTWPNTDKADNLMYGKLNTAKTQPSAGGINWGAVEAYYCGLGTRKLVLIGNGSTNEKKLVKDYFQHPDDIKAEIKIDMNNQVMSAVNLPIP